MPDTIFGFHTFSYSKQHFFAFIQHNQFANNKKPQQVLQIQFTGKKRKADKMQTTAQKNKVKKSKKQKGQGLIEYLILVALMGVATIGVIRVLNQTIKARFASAVYALQGKPKKVKTDSLKEQDYKKSDLSNFMNGAASKNK